MIRMEFLLFVCCVASTGQVQCQDCPVGAYCNDTGMAQYRLCREGSFAPLTSLVLCEPVSPHRVCVAEESYAPLSFLALDPTFVLSLQCPPGFFMDASGAHSCSPCAAGSYAPSNACKTPQGLSSCHLTPLALLIAATACGLCPEGSMSPGAASACTLVSHHP